MRSTDLSALHSRALVPNRARRSRVRLHGKIGICRLSGDGFAWSSDAPEGFGFGPEVPEADAQYGEEGGLVQGIPE